MRYPAATRNRLQEVTMTGGRLNYRKSYNHRDTTEAVVGTGSKPPAVIPRNLLVDPLKGPPMEPIKDVDARPGLRDEDRD
jgi:hypothetical protein